MQRNTIKALIIGAVPLLLLGANAWGGDGVDVTITNDSTDDIVVTVYDLSVGPKAVVLAHAHINGFTSIPISVTPDETGHANLAWTAISTDATSRKCGHAEDDGLANEASLAVKADSECGATL
jgi:hypothetical protein